MIALWKRSPAANNIGACIAEIRRLLPLGASEPSAIMVYELRKRRGFDERTIRAAMAETSVVERVVGRMVVWERL